MILVRKDGTKIEFSPLLNAFKSYKKYYDAKTAYQLARRLIAPELVR